MSSLTLATFLQDDPSRIDQLGNRFRSLKETPPVESVNWAPLLAVGILVLVAVGLLLLLVAMRRNRKHNFHHPRRLFLELAEAHGLNRQQRWFLEELAKHNETKTTAEVFIDPRLFQADRLPRVLQRHPAMLNELRDRLFGDL